MTPARVAAPTLPSVTTRTRAARPWLPWLIDATIALGLSALSLITLASGSTAAGGSDPLSVTLLLLETLPLIVRRRWPIPVFAVTLAATAGHALLADGQVVNESLGALVALFTVAERYERRVSVAAALVAAATFAALIFTRSAAAVAVTGFLSTMLAVVVVLALGDWSQTRRRYATRDRRDRAAPGGGRETVAAEPSRTSGNGSPASSTTSSPITSA